MKPRTHVWLAVALAMGSATAHAELVIDPAPAAPAPVQRMPMVAPAAQPASTNVLDLAPRPVAARPAMTSAPSMVPVVAVPMSPAVIELGGPRPSDAQAVVHGWADQIPVDLALAQVVPNGWTVRAQDIASSKKVSWSGERPWLNVLADVAQRAGAKAQVQWDRKTVVLYPAAWPSAPSNDQVLASSRLVRAGATDLLPATVVTTVVSAPSAFVTVGQAPMASAPSQKWLIDPRLSLRANVEAWAKQAGWNKVVWEAADYELVAPAVFEGEFSDAKGPLAQLIDAYRTSDQPLSVRLSTMDRVVHVINKNYQPASVQPLIPQSVAPYVLGQQLKQ